MQCHSSFKELKVASNSSMILNYCEFAIILVNVFFCGGRYKINVDEDLSRDGHRGVAAAGCRDINVAFLGASAVVIEGLVILLILRLLHAMRYLI